MYRSLIGIYLIPGRLSAEERSKWQNVFPLTLGPHGSNFTDVIGSLIGLRNLDQGVDMEGDDGNKVRFIAAPLAILGDMPQQQQNAGFKGPTAKLCCRKCLVAEHDRHNLDYDTTLLGRYHHAIRSERRRGAAMLKTNRSKFF